MKLIFVLAVLVAVAVAVPVDNVEVLRLENDNIGVDGYKFGFDLSDGTSRQEQGVLNNIGTDNEAIEVQGTSSWVAPDGKKITITYVADGAGYRPKIEIS